ncbi:hypothetical protein Q1695_011244 [Nippostrongylus brasiliensis]|nr:hypothetical protein Q1695_011244 [Nippostrongylus brasiliensis]
MPKKLLGGKVEKLFQNITNAWGTALGVDKPPPDTGSQTAIGKSDEPTKRSKEKRKKKDSDQSSQEDTSKHKRRSKKKKDDEPTTKVMTMIPAGPATLAPRQPGPGTMACSPSPAAGTLPPGAVDGQSPPPVGGATSPPPVVPEVQKWVQRALDMGVEALRQEYRGLARYTLPEMTVDAFKANQEFGRNRYQDVPCQDQHRVILKWHTAATEYIHANFVGTPVSPRRFILTQGPLDGTVNEFWQMVLQEEAETIIMLCNCIETGKNKCAPYWPDRTGDTRRFNGGEVVNTQTRVLSPEELTVQVCILNVKFTKADGSSDTREIRHYQWLDWPDRGVPPCKLTSMELLSRVRGTSKPIVVHCSAGIGRTGTIVAIEYILERMQAGHECAAMNDLLKELRNQRAYTIQNDLQYLYIHRVMLCYFLEKHRVRYEAILTDENKAKYKKFVEEYNQVTGT